MKKFESDYNETFYVVRTRKNWYLIQEHFNSTTKNYWHRVDLKGLDNINHFIKNNKLKEVPTDGTKVEFNIRKNYEHGEYDRQD